MLKSLIVTTTAFLGALLGPAIPAHGQDCNGNGISDAMEIGPYRGAVRGRVFNAAFSLDERLSAPSGSLFRTVSFSVSFWVYRDASDPGNGMWLTVGPPGRANQSMHIGFRSDNRFTFAFWDNDLNTVDAFPPDSQWHHWSCTFDINTRTRRIYRDGVLVAQDFASVPFLGSGDLVIGGWIDGASSATGAIDSVFVHLEPLDADDTDAIFLSRTETYARDSEVMRYEMNDGYLGFGGEIEANDAINGSLSLSTPSGFRTPNSVDYIEDCDGNGVLDTCQVLVPDCNPQGVPAEGCLTDCNANGIDDALEVADGSVADVNSNGIPDSCDSDCSNGGVISLADRGPFIGSDRGRYFDPLVSIPQRLSGFKGDVEESILQGDLWLRHEPTGSDEVWAALVDTHGQSGAPNVQRWLGLGCDQDGNIVVYLRNERITTQAVTTPGVWAHYAYETYVTSDDSSGIDVLTLVITQDGEQIFSLDTLNPNYRDLQFGDEVFLLVGGAPDGSRSAGGIFDNIRLWALSRDFPRPLEKLYGSPLDYLGQTARLDEIERCADAANNDVGGGVLDGPLTFTSFPYVSSTVPAPVYYAQDCDGNLINDLCETSSGGAVDINANGLPDECEECAVDVNGDGLLDFFDVIEFLQSIDAGSIRSDLTKDGVTNADDAEAFLDLFADAC